MSTIKLIHIPYSLLDFLSLSLDNSITGAYGASCMLLHHTDPNKVWIVSFDLDRYRLYRQLGIQVGTLYEKLCTYVVEDQIRYQEYVVFECEKLRSIDDAPDDAQARFESLFEAYDEQESYYGIGNMPFPQQLPELQNLLWGFDCRDNFDWSTCNALYRPSDGSVFLSDVMYHDDDLCPYDVFIDPSQFLWLETLP